MRRDALFRIYSMTKPITGVALMTLYDEGRFELDDPVAKYLPGFDKVKVFAGEDGDTVKLVDLKRPVTIRDLMRHTAGLAYGLFPASPVDEMYKEAKMLDRTKNLDSMIERLVKIPLAAQPGEKWMYSIAVDVQGKLIEALSGKPLDEFFAERVFKPLAMKDTGVLRAGRQARSPDRELRQEGRSPVARRWIQDEPVRDQAGAVVRRRRAGFDRGRLFAVRPDDAQSGRARRRADSQARDGRSDDPQSPGRRSWCRSRSVRCRWRTWDLDWTSPCG